MIEQQDPTRQVNRAVQVAESFVSLADTLVDDFDVVELLDRLVGACVRLLDVHAAAIMLVNHDQSLDVVASSDEQSRLMEVIQLESQAGPCIDVVRTGEPVSVTETSVPVPVTMVAALLIASMKLTVSRAGRVASTRNGT